MINVTYVGDQLIAYKVTGDKNVPRGEITFQADLNPLHQNNGIGNVPYSTSSTNSSSTAENLEPINLTDTTSTSQGTWTSSRNRIQK
jgi:hypothetical protein